MVWRGCAGGSRFTIIDATRVSTAGTWTFFWRWRDTAKRRNDRDGTKDGYDIPMTNAIAIKSVDIPVIASGGIRAAERIYDAFVGGQMRVFAGERDSTTRPTMGEIKEYLRGRGME